MRLDGVEAVAAGSVLVVVTDVREHRVAGPTEGCEVCRLGHVTVVVDPGGQHLSSVEIERGRHGVAGLPTGRRMQQAALLVDLCAARSHKLNIHSGFACQDLDSTTCARRRSSPRQQRCCRSVATPTPESSTSPRRQAPARPQSCIGSTASRACSPRRWRCVSWSFTTATRFASSWQRRPQSSCGSCSKQCCVTTTGHCGWSCACLLCATPTAAAERDRMDRRWRAMLRKVIRDGQERGEFIERDAEETMFVLAALLDGMAPLLAMKAKGVTRAHVERTWLAEASRLLGPGFQDVATPTRWGGRVSTSTCPLHSPWPASTARISSAGSGRAMKYPCTCPQPADLR